MPENEATQQTTQQTTQPQTTSQQVTERPSSTYVVTNSYEPKNTENR